MARLCIYFLVVMVTVFHNVLCAKSLIIHARSGRVEDHYNVILQGASPSIIPLILDDLEDNLGNNVFKKKDAQIYSHALVGFAMKMNQIYEPLLEAVLDECEMLYDIAYYVEEVSMMNGTDISWGQDRIDQRSSNLDGFYNAAGSGQGVNVYVADTGIKQSNKYFGNRVNLFYDYDSSRPRKKMCHQHGTHVAGVVGSNDYGVANGVQLHSVRILNCNNAGTSSAILGGLDYIVANGETPGVVVLAITGAFLQSLNDAVEAVTDAGFVVVIAAGNGASDACNFSPASVDNGLTVAATDSSDHATGYSNYGSCVDIFAPGNYIRTPGFSSKDVPLVSGTSMACPFIGGIAAIHLQKNPTYTPAQVMSDILSTATTGTVYGNGITNGSPSILGYIDPNFMNT